MLHVLSAMALIGTIIIESADHECRPLIHLTAYLEPAWTNLVRELLQP